MKKKTSIPLDQVIKTSCDTVQQKWKQTSWASHIHNQYFQSQALVSLWSHFSIHCILSRSPRTSSKPAPPMLLIWRWICFYPASPGHTDENQPITNLKPCTNLRPHHRHHYKSWSFHQKIAFLLKFMWYKRNDLTTNKLSIFLLVADFANHAKFVFSWLAWVV